MYTVEFKSVLISTGTRVARDVHFSQCGDHLDSQHFAIFELTSALHGPTSRTVNLDFSPTIICPRLFYFDCGGMSESHVLDSVEDPIEEEILHMGLCDYTSIFVGQNNNQIIP